MKKLGRWLFRIGSVVLLLLVVLAAWLVYLAQTRLPMLDGVLTHPSLKAEVKVTRDNWGVPHINAQNAHDAYFALGYAMGQDRLFQMEVVRRLAQGEIAEIAGPLAVKVDAIIRAFRLKHKAQETMARLQGKQPEVQEAAQAFCDGLNFRQQNEPLPFEFTVLGIPAHNFVPEDCLSVGALLPIAFADGMREDPLATMVRARHPEMNADPLFPSYSLEIPVTVMESIDEAKAFLEAKKAAATGATPDSDKKPEPGKVSEAERGTEASLAALQALLDPFRVLSNLMGPNALGSNSWVVGGSRTKSGKPILCNDPHIPFTNPSVWYEAHLTYPGFDFYGYHLALIPFALIGHDKQHAWALTMLANDDIDLYAETFDPANPMKVKYKNEWTDVKIEEERVNVRMGAEQVIPIRITPHGPIITDLSRFEGGYEGPDVALSWVWQRTEYTDLLGFFRMARAKNLDEFQAATALCTSPGVNVSYADADGHIAWWAAGKIEIRENGVDYKSILNGADGSAEPLGFVPTEENPHLIDPPIGYIVTANNKSTVKPVGVIDDMQGYWQPGDRAQRIKDLLDTRTDWDVDGLKKVQFDDVAWAAPMVTKNILDLIDASGAALNDTEQAARAVLSTWDHAHGKTSAGASIYQYSVDEILAALVIDEMGEKLFQVYTTMADHWNFFKYAIQNDNVTFWDDINTPEKESRQAIVLKSFRTAVAKLQNRLGGAPETWAWGRIHTMEFKHPFGYLPLLGKIFNVGPFPSSGGSQIVNNMLYRAGMQKYDVLAGPSTRRIVDFAAPEHALGILPTGNSGNFMSPNYGDQAQMFMNGEYRELIYTQEQIAKMKTHELVLKPGA